MKSIAGTVPRDTRRAADIYATLVGRRGSGPIARADVGQDMIILNLGRLKVSMHEMLAWLRAVHDRVNATGGNPNVVIGDEAVGRPMLDMPRVVEAIAWRFCTRSPWRDVPERLGNWNSIYSYFADWCKDGTWEQVLAPVQTGAQRAGDLEWTVAIDSTITRVHQHGASLSRGPSRDTGGLVELQESV